MKVILRSDVPKLGRKQEVVSVSDGYARNFLVPKRLADYATESVMAQVEHEQAKKAERLSQQMQKLRSALQSITKKGITINAPANDQGHLFAAVHTDDVAEALSGEIGDTVPPSAVSLAQDIKETGTHTATISITEEEKIEIPISVASKQ